MPGCLQYKHIFSLTCICCSSSDNQSEIFCNKQEFIKKNKKVLKGKAEILKKKRKGKTKCAEMEDKNQRA